MNKPKPIKEIRIMFAEEVQQILIRNDWFALATNKEYAQFLDYVRKRYIPFTQRRKNALPSVSTL